MKSKTTCHLCGHLHSLCPQQTPKFPSEGSQCGGNCPGRPRSPDKPDPAVDISTLRDPRNEQADRLAREGVQPDQESMYNSYVDEKMIIKTLTKKKKKKKKKKKRKQQHPSFNQSDSLHKLNRPEQVILLRLGICASSSRLVGLKCAHVTQPS